MKSFETDVSCMHALSPRKRNSKHSSLPFFFS